MQNSTPPPAAQAMPPAITVRALRESDYEAWLPLWAGYNAFYGREGATALDPEITRTTWRRFFDPARPCDPAFRRRAGGCHAVPSQAGQRWRTR